jgi:adenylate kinase
MPSRVDDICDHCGNRLIQRADDTPESIHRRLVEYEEKTAPLIHYYEERGVLYHIDANEGPDAVFVKVQDVLRKIAC